MLCWLADIAVKEPQMTVLMSGTAQNVPFGNGCAQGLLEFRR
jgi:hypothetical protein